MVRIGEAEQSFVDPSDPTRLEFDYVQRIADVIDIVAPTGERIGVVHIGGAGLTLPRYVAHTRPTSAQIVFEPDEELTAEVRLKAPLPPRSGIKVRPFDGRAGLAQLPADYTDLVIIDAFAGAQVPGDLVSIEAFAQVHRVLKPTGTLVLNVTDAAPLQWTRRVVSGLERYLSHRGLMAEASTLKGRRFGNIVLIASRVELDWDTLQRRAAGAAFPFRLTTGVALQQFVGGAGPFFDAATEPSPAPPHGATAFS